VGFDYCKIQTVGRFENKGISPTEIGSKASHDDYRRRESDNEGD